MADHHIRATIHRQASLGPVGRRGLAHVGDAPVERDDHAVNLIPKAADVGGERGGRVHGAARQVRGRRAAAWGLAGL